MLRLNRIKSLYAEPEKAIIGVIGVSYEDKKPYADISGCADKEAPNEACYYEMLPENEVRCQLCYRECLIEEGNRGFCRSRENRNGRLICASYGRPGAVAIDPVEKEPFYHLRPGSRMLSVGGVGCNFRCTYCHNWHLSQQLQIRVQNRQELMPEDLIERAVEKELDMISFTYNEPAINYEYLIDTAAAAAPEDLEVVFHTNGAINPDPLSQLLEYVDGVCLDLKGFSEETYQKMQKARLEPVLETLKMISDSGSDIWLEIVYLLLTDRNDDEDEIRAMCRWLVDNTVKEYPLHFNRAVPAYKEDLRPTPVKNLERAREIALEEGLEFVYIGNVPGHKANSTYCPDCGSLLISRRDHEVFASRLEGGNCSDCGRGVPGRWS